MFSWAPRVGRPRHAARPRGTEPEGGKTWGRGTRSGQLFHRLHLIQNGLEAEGVMARSAAIEEGALQTGGRFCRHKHIRDFMRCNSRLRHTRVHGWLCWALPGCHRGHRGHRSPCQECRNRHREGGSRQEPRRLGSRGAGATIGEAWRPSLSSRGRCRPSFTSAAVGGGAEPQCLRHGSGGAGRGRRDQCPPRRQATRPQPCPAGCLRQPSPCMDGVSGVTQVGPPHPHIYVASVAQPAGSWH